ncbi:hypothetical protein RhiirA4_456173 [Rhizophagus irregularis]|uniref:Serine-threonine/tyrosine-protein kinase catalytic domain-containing protein n=1 Tax=Rhizophagus irregularis TaxID=588596 RepID=A0A2I1G731_9GLOM|nr:hypothetical protein RhiirA4_456173 [Rhizophagus irregularis]
MKKYNTTSYIIIQISASLAYNFVLLKNFEGNISFLDICKGEHPLIPEYTPEPYAALMKLCWDSIPTNRLSANELCRQIRDWYDILYELNQLVEIEEFSPGTG